MDKKIYCTVSAQKTWKVVSKVQKGERKVLVRYVKKA
jgi:hypothetical protein